MSDSRTPSLMPDAPRLLSHVRPFQTVKGPKCCQRNCHLADAVAAIQMVYKLQVEVISQTWEDGNKA